MPHQCVRCSTMYGDGAQEILKGCPCGGKFFFYIRKEALKKNKLLVKLSNKEKVRIEKDVYDLIGDQIDKEKPVILDLESINILKPGVYELDLVRLFRKKPLIYKLEEGKYVIDLIESFKELK